MKKNINLSVLFLSLAVVWYFGLIALGHLSITLFNFFSTNFFYGYLVLYGPSAVLSVLGTKFAFKNRIHDKSLVSSILPLIGFIFSLISLFPFFLLIYLAFFFGR